MNDEIDQKLHLEVLNLIQYIHRLRKEIAGIAAEQDDQTTFDSMADRLDAIVDSTMEATNTILGAMEDVDNLVEKLRGQSEGAEIGQICDQISEKTMAAVEACSFQDLTGQRINKVVGSMKFVEERVNSMADICGREEIQSIGVNGGPPVQMDDGIALDGPQRKDEAISQDDIDALFD